MNAANSNDIKSEVNNNNGKSSTNELASTSKLDTNQQSNTENMNFK